MRFPDVSGIETHGVGPLLSGLRALGENEGFRHAVFWWDPVQQLVDVVRYVLLTLEPNAMYHDMYCHVAYVKDNIYIYIYIFFFWEYNMQMRRKMKC